jgi:hypothetical protein
VHVIHQPNQRGTDTALQFPFSANAAIRRGDKDTAIALPLRPSERRHEVRQREQTNESPRRDRDEAARAVLADFGYTKRTDRDKNLSISPKAQDSIDRLKAVETTSHDAASADPFHRSGQGSRLVETDLPKGEYKLAWTVWGAGSYFRVLQEHPSKAHLVNEALKRPAQDPTTGELFLRIDASGRQIFSVNASKLDWRLTFTPL